MGTTITFEKDPINEFCSIAFDNDYFHVNDKLYRRFKEFVSENTREFNDMVTKIENQRKELSSLLAKNKRLEEENAELRDISNKNFWPNGKAPVVDFPVLQYDSIPSWFDFTFTNFRYDSRRTLNLPGKITIEGVSDDRKKIDAFVEHGDMFGGIFSICRMSDIKELVDKYNALVVDNRHLELEKASTLDSLSGLKTDLDCTRKKMEAARDEYEKMKEVLKRWHDATGCDNFEQAKKKIEELTKLRDSNKEEIWAWRNATGRYTPENAKTRYDGLKASNTQLQAIVYGADGGYKPVDIGGENQRPLCDYLANKGYNGAVDAINKLEKQIQCAEGTYTVFIHPDHMDALLIDVKHDRYQAETRLIEECSELIQALAKRKRTYSPEVNYIGSHELTELAHVIISAIVYCRMWDISNELLQKAVQMKYPEPYTKDTVED